GAEQIHSWFTLGFDHADRCMQGYPQAADIGAAGAGQIQGGAVIHRGADDGQAQGDVHRLAESLVLEHRQALVVIHGQYRVGMVQILGREESVRRQGAFQQHALATQALEQWDDHIQLLAAQMATLAGMGVQPADQDAWGGQAELGLQVPVEYAYDLFEGLVGDGIGYCAQWQVGGGQGHAQAGAGQHHYHLGGAGLLGEEFGMSGEAYAGIVDDTLVYGRGNHRSKMPVQAALAAQAQGFEDVTGVARIKLARDAGAGQGHRQHAQLAGLLRLWGLRGVKEIQLNVEAEHAGPLGQHVGIGDHDSLMGAGLGGQLQAQIGPDAGGFAGGKGNGQNAHLTLDLYVGLV